MFNPEQYEAARPDRAGAALRSVLIVEDDWLLALMAEDLVRAHGATEVLACRDASEALRVVDGHQLDCAILDIAMHGGSTYPVADALAARHVPFLFCTGVSPADVAERHRSRPLLAKPYGEREFRTALGQTLGW